MYFVYFIRSQRSPNLTYIGYTTDIKNRFMAHNQGRSPHTSKYKPWILHACFAFKEKHKALEFERYLKSHAG